MRDYVITTFQQGGLEAYKLDIEIPQKYGVEQCVGDTLGPGGVFRALRTIPVLLDLCSDMDELAPDALLLNYVNPMAANCWAVADGTGRPHVGLCHSVQGTSEMLARWIGVPYDEVNFVCAGINHQAFFLQFNRGKEDVYPLLWEAIERPEVMAEEPVRTELMQYFGYFVTESSGHASEYVPYFRKTAKMVERRAGAALHRRRELLVRLWPHGRLSAPLSAPAGAVPERLRRDRGWRIPHPALPRVRLARSSRPWRPTSRPRSPATCPTTG